MLFRTGQSEPREQSQTEESVMGAEFRMGFNACKRCLNTFKKPGLGWMGPPSIMCVGAVCVCVCVVCVRVCVCVCVHGV